MKVNPEQNKDTRDQHIQSVTASQELWRKKIVEFSRVTDRAGEPIDPGVLDAVVAMNLLGVNTRQSCEGHLDSDGVRTPWIDIESGEANTLEQIYDQQQSDEALDKLIEANLEETQKLIPYLNDFYSGREVTAQRRLVLRRLGTGMRIESQGAALYSVPTPKQLMDYKREMRNFGDYLKHKFLAS